MTYLKRRRKFEEISSTRPMDEAADSPQASSASVKNNNDNGEASASKTKVKPRGKRRRVVAESSSDGECELPENMLETENSVHASAIKNNIEEKYVRKILKRVVTNGRVLQFVKRREEKELASGDKKPPAKLTRAKYKELKKVAPETSPLDNIVLTPIKHIPVKTRPEVTALIAQELPEDEDDGEYEFTHDDVPSDDDQTLESCSDLDSQPRTPATPKSQASSPKVVTDGPFKVPQIAAATKRKLDMDEEEATIARRTRSKLSLSSTSIEHIESTFVPPDDLPMPAADDLWSQFLNECLDPTSTTRNEEDDEADPEYNAAADAEAVDEDEDNLSKNILKISKKELSDLVTELFDIMPEDLENDLINSILTEPCSSELPRWEGKQEPPEEVPDENNTISNVNSETNACNRFSIGKTEPEGLGESAVHGTNEEIGTNKENLIDDNQNLNNYDEIKIDVEENVVIIEIKEEETPKQITAETPRKDPNEQCVTMYTITEQVVETPNSRPAPPLIQKLFNEKQQQNQAEVVKVHMGPGLTILPNQILILQQQLRQHIQMATFNFLQLHMHPIHWDFARHYKEYLGSLVKIGASNPKSVVNVCNLTPASELIATWEATMAEKTDEVEKMLKFIMEEAEKCQHRTIYSNTILNGDFPEQLKRVVANSGVFLYPHLLPYAPYRPDHLKRFHYIQSEDELIALGLEQFWSYVENNRKLFKVRAVPSGKKRRAGLSAAIELVAKHMLPWMTPRHILCHVCHLKKHGHSQNPIVKYLKTSKIEPVKHVLLPFNPQMTLYEHPESDIPRPWVKYLSKTSNRFKKPSFNRKLNLIQPTAGVPIDMGKEIEVPKKNPLPIDFNQGPVSTTLPQTNLAVNPPKQDTLIATNMYTVVQTSTGMVLVPLMVQNTSVVSSQAGPITTPAEVQSSVNVVPQNTQDKDMVEVRILDKPKNINLNENHCECCILLRKICKDMKLITDYFKPKKPMKKECQCTDRRFPKVSNRLKVFLNIFQSQSLGMLKELENRLKSEVQNIPNDSNPDDLEYAILYQMRFLVNSNVKTNKSFFKKNLYKLFNEFNIFTDDPVQLAQKVFSNIKEDCMFLYNDFLGFLTAEQADNMSVFNHYLASHMSSLMKRVDEDLPDIDRRKTVVKILKKYFDDSKETSSCQLCKSLLTELKDSPHLAKYVFSLFPHKICVSRDVTLQRIQVDVETSTPSVEPASDNQEVENEEQAVSSDEIENAEPGQIIAERRSIDQEEQEIVKLEPTSDEECDDQYIDEDTDYNKALDKSMVLIQKIKDEERDWTRDEDKVLLETIKLFLATEESKDKSIYKILQDNKVYELISERMTDKCMDDIVQRVLYLLEVLVGKRELREI